MPTEDDLAELRATFSVEELERLVKEEEAAAKALETPPSNSYVSKSSLFDKDCDSTQLCIFDAAAGSSNKRSQSDQVT